MDNALQDGYLSENCRLFHLIDSAGQEKDFHFHTFDKIVYMKSGSVKYQIEDQTIKLVPGSILLVKNHVIHKAIIDTSIVYDRAVIYLNHDYFKQQQSTASLMECFGDTYSPDNCHFHYEADSSDLIENAIIAYDLIKNRNLTGDTTLKETYVTQILVAVARASEGIRFDTQLHNTKNSEKITDALEYINDHFREDLKIEDIALIAYMSKYHFMRVFKEYTGTTVHNYIKEKRLLCAARLIREGMPIGSAAELSGFNDYSTFNRAFNSCFGFKPSSVK